MRVARLEILVIAPLSVRLNEPFVIATGRVDVTRSAEVRVRLTDGTRAAEGLGEGAALWPVTVEDQPEVLAALSRAASSLSGHSFPFPDVDGVEPVELEALRGLTDALDAVFVDKPVARAAMETAILDAWARLEGMPLRKVLGGAVGAKTQRLCSDITIPIGEPARMAELAKGWYSLGFRSFKVKVGKDLEHDLRALFAVASVGTGVTLRIDANEGFSAEQAIVMGRAMAEQNIPVECYEQPCRADDLVGMAAVAEALSTPVVADESVKTVADLKRVRALLAADGVNLKLVKSGGMLGALAIGRAAKAAGMPLMIGGMVETRLGMTAGAHVAAALGGVEFVDLDTAWLLAEDPYRGGYVADGPLYTLSEEPGLGIETAARSD